MLDADLPYGQKFKEVRVFEELDCVRYKPTGETGTIVFVDANERNVAYLIEFVSREDDDCLTWCGEDELELVQAIDSRESGASKKGAFPSKGASLGKGDLARIHEFSSANLKAVGVSGACGCFYCQSIFPAKEVWEFVQDFDDAETGLCPICEIAALLPSASLEAEGIALNESLLAQMGEFWFGASR